MIIQSLLNLRTPVEKNRFKTVQFFTNFASLSNRLKILHCPAIYLVYGLICEQKAELLKLLPG